MYRCDSSDADNTDENKLGFKLRALTDELDELQANPWTRATTLAHSVQATPLSNELVNETLNYFVNCRQRLSQMTKTYDDNDAYILLLQEKEVDLELAARIGQDLLKQNKELKDSIKNLQDELFKRQEDVQQLRHELASKTILLDTFIEEEEHQTSLAEAEEDSVLLGQQQDLHNKLASLHQLPQQSEHTKNSQPVALIDDGGHDGFLSLNYQQQKSATASAEPFSSLPCNFNRTPTLDLHPLTRDDSTDTLADESNISGSHNHRSTEQQRLVESVTFQLVESNKRLCELQDELFYKGEQTMLQQEKIYQLQQQLKESDRRLDDVASENETLRQTIIGTSVSHKELIEELKSCKQNFTELLNVFLELQKESRINRNLQHNSNPTYYPEDLVNDINNISFDSYKNTPFDNEQYNHANCSSYDYFNSNNKINGNIVRPLSRNDMCSSSLHEEIQESMQKILEDHSSDGDATDENDSGVHTRATLKTNSTSANNKPNTKIPSTTNAAESSSSQHPSSSSSSASSSCFGDTLTTRALAKVARRIADITNTNNHIDTKTDSENISVDRDSDGKKNWQGLSTFMLTTILLLCISVTFTSSTNSNIAQRLQIKMDR